MREVSILCNLMVVELYLDEHAEDQVSLHKSLEEDNLQQCDAPYNLQGHLLYCGIVAPLNQSFVESHWIIEMNEGHFWISLIEGSIN